MTHPPITDAVVAAAVGGDEEARARLLEAAAGRVRGMVLVRLAADPDRWNAAEDVLQEALVALDRGVGSLQNATARAWLAFQSTVVAHKVADHFRARRAPRPGAARTPRRRDASSVGPLLSVLEASGPSPSSAAMRREAAVVALDELATLSERHRDVIALAIFDHLDTREIGRRLGVSRTSAANLLARALDALRGRWADRVAREGTLP